MTAAPLTRPPGPRRGGLTALAKAAAGPLICAALLTGLLSAWVAAGAAGTLTKAGLRVTQAAVPMRSTTPSLAATISTAGTYLTISNLTGHADELVAVRSPDAGRVILATRAGLGTAPRTAASLTVPAHGTLTLTPVGDDAILVDPALFENHATVPLTLVFRDAGQLTVAAPVTIPGTAGTP